MTNEEFIAEWERQRPQREAAIAAKLGIPVEVYRSMNAATYRKMKKGAAQKNKITYQEFVAWAEELAYHIPEGPYKAAFLDTAKRRWGQTTPDDTISVMETVEFDFRAIMRGMEYREGGQGT